MAILNRYKDTLYEFINSLDAKSLDRPELIDKRSYNALKSQGSWTDPLKRNYLNKDISDKSSWLTPKTGDSQVYQCHDVAFFDSKNRKSQYKKVQRGKKDMKSQKSREGY